MSEIVYSTDGERFEEFADAMETLRDELDPGEEATIEKGIAIKASHAGLVRGLGLIENLQELAYDAHGEWAEDYLEDLTAENAGELEGVITKWLDENAKKPDFYRVKNVENVTVTVE